MLQTVSTGKDATMQTMLARRQLEGLADSELLARIAGHDLEAFEVLMRRHNRALYRTARAILRDDHEAEDCVQDVYLSVYRHMDGFREQSQLATWLVRITANAALERLRKRRREQGQVSLDNVVDLDTQTPLSLMADDATAPDINAQRGQWRALLERKIDLLPDAFRPVFILRAIEEMTVEETAVCLQIPEATVRTRYFRARGMLREAIANEIDVAMEGVFEFLGARCDRIVEHVLHSVAPPGS